MTYMETSPKNALSSPLLPTFFLCLLLGLSGCVSVDPAATDPSGPDAAEISGSAALGSNGVDISLSAINDEPRIIGPKPTWKRRVNPGQNRITVTVVKLLLNGATEFPFVAFPGRRYEVRARDGGGFYFVDLVDVTDSANLKVVAAGKFAATGSVLIVAPFTALPVSEK
jgi:hypothetical protein